MRVPALVATVLFAGFLGACSLGGSSHASTARITGSSLAPASGKLDAQVAMPPDFPRDVPIYPGARLTAGAQFESAGQVAWGMEWETLDPVAKVQAYYDKEMSTGDWTITFSTPAPEKFAARFSRKSNSQVAGTLVGDATSGVTKILMSLTSPR